MEILKCNLFEIKMQHKNVAKLEFKLDLHVQ